MKQQFIDLRAVEDLIKHVFASPFVRIEPVAQGVSTSVYRLSYQHDIFYLRILPEVGESFAPEVIVHSHLRQIGVRVPEVIYFEACHEPLQRSVMIVTQIQGQPISQPGTLTQEDIRTVLLEAGKDLARINSLSVAGFGWIARDQQEATTLRAQWPSYQNFLLEHWESDLQYLGTAVLHSSEVNTLEHLLAAHLPLLSGPQGQLAHGDFDTTHIYQERGRYTGVIDFGEIRGADRWYDLAHFHLRDGEYLPAPLLPFLVQGYGEVTSLPADYDHLIRLNSLLINVRLLVHSLQKQPPDRYTQHQLRVLREDLATLHRAPRL